MVISTTGAGGCGHGRKINVTDFIPVAEIFLRQVQEPAKSNIQAAQSPQKQLPILHVDRADQFIFSQPFYLNLDQPVFYLSR